MVIVVQMTVVIEKVAREVKDGSCRESFDEIHTAKISKTIT